MKSLWVVFVLLISPVSFAQKKGIATKTKPNPTVQKKYPEKTDITLPVLEIKGDIHNPTELYFQRKQEERFDSLVERRKNFHPQMLRDITVSK